QTNGATLAERGAAWMNRIQASEADLAASQAEIDGRCFDLYGIDQADRHGITEGIGAAVDTTIDGAEPKLHGEGLDDREQEDDDTEPEEATADAISLDTDLLSWAAGVAFGRFDVRIATGERVPPAEPDPFDTLPVCSPGMLTGDDGLPLRQTPADYPLVLPDDGLMADDPGHPRDLTTAVRAVFELVFDADADARWHEAAAMLDPQDRDLRRWFGKVFFEKHLKRYSKSRRKAPILWQLATPSASYSVWLYIHRLTKDSFYQLQNDLVAPKRAHEERKLASLTQAAGDSPTASQRKEIAAQEAFVDELRTLRDEVARIAPLWDPDLNDGVVITAAPLWRLVPQHKSWQKELQIVWDALCAGKYDWSYLSMHLWPERVVPKCADDRSLAIAHDLEDMLWVKDNGRWRKLTEPKQEIAEHKTGRDKEAYRRLRDGLETLADRADATLAAAELWRQLEADKLDESLAALCLWPRRVLELCTADPDLARRLEVKLPAKRTKAALDKLVKQYETAGYGDLLDVVRAALAECNEPFRDLWQQLADGRLDDLPLALALWPDRVVDRCTEDRELADRHDLARYFWYHEPTGDWRRRKSPDQEVADEVARRHNPTVKAALQSLLDAGSPTGGKGGRKRKR
ncbi:MAG: hypothetical protein NTY19_23245, partial [Planctomycetota bacterium]|nr:hypothetical protein [Planctomycetota bacterium]